jgi:DNA-binding NtrC family response regulator
MTQPTGVRILVVEDDAALSEVLVEELQTRGMRPQPATTVASALEQLKTSEFDVALVDLMLPDGSGIDVLRRISEEELPTEAIVLTGYAQVKTAIEAMKLGAYDYVTKPATMDELEVLVQKAAEKSALRRDNTSMRARLERLDASEGFVTEDPAMRELLETLERAASSELPILIEGESGTGKELLARAVHKRSPRAAEPFVAISCAAVPENLVESELFGYERGAFTGALQRKPGLFEVAHRGVLFLDEIGEISPTVQAKLLRVVETKEFIRVGGTRTSSADVRLVAATNKNLVEETRAGRFREDLYYRLNGVLLRVPPLRERKGDVPLLAMHFLKKVGSKQTFTPRAIEALKAYPWPGNVREMLMVVQRAATLCRKDTIDAADVPLETERNWKSAALKSGLTLAELETEYIRTVLDQNQGHRGKAARALGIDPKTLYNKLGPERARKPS